MAYIVANSRTVKLPNGSLKSQGEQVTEEECGKENIQSHLESGFLVDTRTAPPQTAPSSPNPADMRPTSPWKLDPAQLEGKPLQELNLMIKERDDSIEPFETVEEAIAQLSADHGD